MSKTTLKFILGSALLVSFAVTGCNNESSEKTESKTDSTTVEKMKEETPAPVVVDTLKKDTLKKELDRGNTKPIIPPNK
jgi:hypothetical protein